MTIFLCISIFYVYMFACVHLCVQACSCTCVCRYTWMSGAFLGFICLLFSLLQGFSLEPPGLTDSVGSLIREPLGSPCLLPQPWDCKHVPPCPAQYTRCYQSLCCVSCPINPSLESVQFILFLAFILRNVLLFVFLECVCTWEWDHWVPWFFIENWFDSGCASSCLHCQILLFWFF